MSCLSALEVGNFILSVDWAASAAVGAATTADSGEVVDWLVMVLLMWCCYVWFGGR